MRVCILAIWLEGNIQKILCCILVYGCKLKLFTYICEHSPQFSHCVLMDMNTGELLPMCHTSNFRLVSDEEC